MAALFLMCYTLLSQLNKVHNLTHLLMISEWFVHENSCSNAVQYKIVVEGLSPNMTTSVIHGRWCLLASGMISWRSSNLFWQWGC